MKAPLLQMTPSVLFDFNLRHTFLLGCRTFFFYVFDTLINQRTNGPEKFKPGFVKMLTELGIASQNFLKVQKKPANRTNDQFRFTLFLRHDLLP
jgi:hypothetical protein